MQGPEENTEASENPDRDTSYLFNSPLCRVKSLINKSDAFI